MSERKESSLLFSLRELQTIEEERVREESEVAQRAEAEKRRAAEEEARRVREAEEAKIRAAEEAVRVAREAEERVQREQQLRAEEAARRARVDEQARIEQERIAQELRARAAAAASKRPTALLAIAGLLVAAIAVLGYVYYQQVQEKERLAAEKALQEEEFERKLAEAQNEVAAAIEEQVRRNEAISLAKTEEERIAAQQAYEAAKSETKKKQEAMKAIQKEIQKTDACPKDQPICGLE